LGDLYLNRTQPAEAVASYNEAFSTGRPAAARQIRAVEGLMMLGETGRAQAMLDKLADPARLTPRQRRRVLRLRGDLARTGGQLEAALKIYRTLLKEDPLNGRVLVAVGDLQRTTGKLEDAVMAYERAARITGYEARGLVRQAQVEVERGRYKRAVELLEAAQVFEDQPHITRYLDQLRRMAR
jgi:tetratricopeptide (TPR) repeat protein